MAYPFQIQFDGIICHADVVDGKPGAGKRAIFPDGRAHGGHILYVEFYATNYDEEANPGLRPISYTRWGQRLARLEFHGVEFEFPNIVSPRGLHVSSDYDWRVPKLKEICPDFGDIKYRDGYVDSQLGAIFSYDRGALISGPAEQHYTWFENVDESKWKRRQVPQWVALNVELSTDEPVLNIHPFDGGTTTTLRLRPGTQSVTLGNQTLDDIRGIEPPVTAPGHFGLYYEVLPVGGPKDCPKPKRGFGLGTGCTNTNYP